VGRCRPAGLRPASRRARRHVPGCRFRGGGEASDGHGLSNPACGRKQCVYRFADTGGEKGRASNFTLQTRPKAVCAKQSQSAARPDEGQVAWRKGVMTNGIGTGRRENKANFRPDWAGWGLGRGQGTCTNKALFPSGRIWEGQLCETNPISGSRPGGPWYWDPKRDTSRLGSRAHAAERLAASLPTGLPIIPRARKAGLWSCVASPNAYNRRRSR